ncbi:hypothetical protein [Flavobacterium johnsoniae]|jgi:uncharacterized membrane protein|uniref:Beta-carotene 15,15'-monooxygenase n=2 Tax=Flavobacterium johnsoniae TaxID=986 RepID=A0A1M6XF06_FLAJO|nr:hypothetical protein [Flavobacterium johnsoniae]ABQ07713.1 hypothetical protein Fjoh_4714 [Flavobacterium johnsoniae UW101]OXG01797.1 hypothetical protein B0A63_03820 [Flavobacterium johnsoniae UW101]WQG80448.1 hypothetical protein SR927_20800 [Flavobacterium johnsoniae UW101]SHG31608.1 hypothetical protein SAMN05444388_102245 [Flavobacterium johnsoniae]SHL04508.1 hypothetical protein SAMN05444146_2767 [Flavobacterium johnsoniae]
MKSTLDQIEDIKKDGYSIDFSTVFNYAVENYKKIALYSGLIILVFSVVAGAVIMGLAVAFYGVQSLSENFIENFKIENLSYVQQIITAASIAAVTALFAPLGAGFLKMADCADKDETFNVSTIFTYYSSPYFLQLFSVAFIIGIVTNGISYFTESLGIGYLGTGVSLFINFFTYFTIPLIIFGNLNAVDAIKSSLVLVSKNPVTIFLLFIVGFLGSLVGLVGCCIGVIFTVVFNSSVTYSAYFSIFNEEEQQDSIDSIGRSDLE